jgi:hypothetical protein
MTNNIDKAEIEKITSKIEELKLTFSKVLLTREVYERVLFKRVVSNTTTQRLDFNETYDCIILKNASDATFYIAFNEEEPNNASIILEPFESLTLPIKVKVVKYYADTQGKILKIIALK